ncbi:undecaprenyl-phosphate 4-deoxy-4-formamido-L-arabinose transferase [bacterium BMS3Bbin12]|nr:undecaprenyl-phosphate 4-deoxy-4-formamido-L-arabinose transferase [bacterium BMS3Abin12]GBE47571.1 undecaprenyl-phosphate 4-deoxy-4-formamido-L-arabinose transferase [bacterium BMS3Bbin12]GBE49684.1 undecaprenyl-phosphate 4-deoxy-4-formamido-L-arabinose transferase [bacterium BMS3Bbin13]HDJ86001.1 glycosyltransferase [Chromatiales bacterium]HDK03674.1 glycosyltransferase [Gammaproteobacteria bacterium]
MNAGSRPTVSVIIPVTERFDDVRELYFRYRDALRESGPDFEITYVLDGRYPDVLDALKGLLREGERLRVVTLSRPFGEATAIMVGFNHSSGDLILTLPAYEQIEPSGIPRLIEGLREQDLVAARRWPRIDSRFNRLQAAGFHFFLNRITGLHFHDMGCGARAFKRRVLEEITLYGDQHRFFPVLAFHQGFRVGEIDVPQSPRDAHQRLYGFGVYLRRLLDMLSVFFLTKFTKKPLRFFGLLGSGVFALGSGLIAYLVVQRLVGGVPLSDRPLLLLASLLLVLGIQIFAIGLVGEIIIFSHAKDIKDYTIDEIIG